MTLLTAPWVNLIKVKVGKWFLCVYMHIPWFRGRGHNWVNGPTSLPFCVWLTSLVWCCWLFLSISDRILVPETWCAAIAAEPCMRGKPTTLLNLVKNNRHPHESSLQHCDTFFMLQHNLSSLSSCVLIMYIHKCSIIFPHHFRTFSSLHQLSSAWLGVMWHPFSRSLSLSR